MRVLFAGMATLLLLAASIDEARAENAPEVTDVIVRAFDGYEYYPTIGLAAEVRVRVDFDSRIAVTGTPQVALQIGSHTRYADFRPESCRFERRSLEYVNYIMFYYYVQATDLGTVSLPAADITLNGGTIKSANGDTDAKVRLRVVDIQDGRGEPIRVDGRLRPDTTPKLGPIRTCSYPKSGNTYKRSEKIQVKVLSLHPAVAVTGKPQLALQIGTQERQAVYDPVPSTPTRLIFSYVVQAADSDNDGFDIEPNPLTLNGGSIVIRGGRTPAKITSPAIQISAGCMRQAERVDGSQTIQGRGPGPIRARFTSVPANGRTYLRGEEIL